MSNRATINTLFSLYRKATIYKFYEVTFYVALIVKPIFCYRFPTMVNLYIISKPTNTTGGCYSSTPMVVHFRHTSDFTRLICQLVNLKFVI